MSKRWWYWLGMAGLLSLAGMGSVNAEEKERELTAATDEGGVEQLPTQIGLSGVVSVSGTSTPVCAMVLANGKSQFSCDGEGHYALDEVQLDSNNQVTLYVWAEGFDPYKSVFTPSGASENVNVAMTVTQCQGADGGTTNDHSSLTQMDLTGEVFLLGTDIPVCALVLANGKSQFSCDGEGHYILDDVPVDINGQVTLLAWAEGFIPYKEVFAPSSTAENRDLGMSLASCYILTVRSSGANGVSITSSTGHGGTTNYTKTGLAWGTNAILTAPASVGDSNFSSWSGCASTSGTECTVSITTNRTVTANYTTISDGTFKGGYGGVEFDVVAEKIQRLKFTFPGDCGITGSVAVSTSNPNGLASIKNKNFSYTLTPSPSNPSIYVNISGSFSSNNRANGNWGLHRGSCSVSGGWSATRQ